MCKKAQYPMISRFNLFNLNQKKAQRLFHEAYDAQVDGDFHKSVRLYQASIDCYPTAEAHTFLGWAYSFLGDLESAIEQCEEAILLDPELGNPYNDIGAYMIALGRYEDAFGYLLRALQAPRYRASHYAHFNIGRVYEHRGDTLNAYRHYKQAIGIEPDYAIARYALERTRQQVIKMNCGTAPRQTTA